MDYATALAAIAAVVAAASAFLSHRLSKNIYNEIKSDEIIVSGSLHCPRLGTNFLGGCLLQCTVFNKSHRKAFISSVCAYNKNREEIPITWSDSIDDIGNILKPTDLLGVEGMTELVLRRNDGEDFKETTVHIKHSFSSSIVELIFEPYKDLE